MRIGLVLPMASGDSGRVLGFARRAEDLGFEGLFAFDHLFPPGAPPDRPSLEAYTTLAAVATITKRVRVGTLVTRASLRPAAVLAKQAAALDDVSEGRFVLAIGTGDELSRPEHEAFGLPYLGSDVRRDHLVETVRAVRALFSGESFPGGRYVPEIAGPLLPAPRTPGGPPVWIGGTSEAAVRAAARDADAWNGWALEVPTFASRAALLREEAGDRPVEPTWGGAVVVGRDAREAGRLVEERRRRGIRGDAFVGDVDATTERLVQLEAAGAAWAILLLAGPPDRLELIGERVLQRLATRP